MNPVWLNSLEDAADFLLAVPNRRVRLAPGVAMTSRHIFIAGEPI
jgi:hypothetical protein